MRHAAARSSWLEFELFCGRQVPEVSALPATAAAVARHLEERLARGNCATSLVSALAVINRVHRYRGHPALAREGAIAEVLDRATLQAPSATGRVPAGRDVVLTIAHSLRASARDLRDRALVWAAFGPLTRSELTALEIRHVVFSPDGKSVTLLGEGDRPAHTLVAQREGRLSPVTALHDWLDFLETEGVTEGPLFRGFLKVKDGVLTLRSTGLSEKGLTELIERWHKLGFPSACTVDSLRLGYEAHRVAGSRDIAEATTRLGPVQPHVVARRLLDAARLGLDVPTDVTRVLESHVGEGVSRTALLELFPVEEVGHAHLEDIGRLAVALEEGRVRVTPHAIGPAPDAAPPDAPVRTSGPRASSAKRRLAALGLALLESLEPANGGGAHVTPDDAGWKVECGGKADRVVAALAEARRVLVVPGAPRDEDAPHFAYAFETA